ncbi:MAG: hypothetical protein NTZ60_09030 [Campylobacterales bacterium]|nr:hypothetical protein [Campylobacterales bacterium]
MFGKIMGKLKGKEENSSKSNVELIDRISKMNLTEMRAYIKNKMENFEVSEEGLIEVLKKLTTLNSSTDKRFIELDDMDSKIKNAFELVLAVSEDKRISIEVVELIQEFLKMYSDIILKYDTANKQIYSSKLKDAIERGISSVSIKADFTRKQNILKN